MAGSGAQNSFESLAVSPDKKDQQDRNDDGHWQPAGVQQDVNEIDVHNNGSKQKQAERDKASEQQEQAADDLEYGNDVKVVAQEKRLAEVSKQSRRGRRHRNKVQKDVRPEHDKNESEKNTSNNGGNFHARIVT
jgi:hypothetical protein